MNEEPQAESKSKGKKGSLWPWLVAIGGGSILYYFHRKKKTVEALAKARQAQLEAQARPAEEEAKLGGNHPGLKRGQEGSSANNRLRAILGDQGD